MRKGVCDFSQVYGDAVAEEAPVFAISNYNVTFFCHRNLSDVTDKRIWASPPISWDSSLLPPRAAWLHFMAFGQQCRDENVKCHLLRSSVPLTPKEGYALQNGSQQARLQLNAA